MPGSLHTHGKGVGGGGGGEAGAFGRKTGGQFRTTTPLPTSASLKMVLS